MNMEIFTPKAQGFLNHVKRIRVSRELSRTREGQAMRMRLILRSPLGGRLHARLLSTPGRSTGELLRTPWMNGCFQANIPAVSAAGLR